jgi:hypothetical protein
LTILFVKKGGILAMVKNKRSKHDRCCKCGDHVVLFKDYGYLCLTCDSLIISDIASGIVRRVLDDKS